MNTALDTPTIWNVAPRDQDKEDKLCKELGVTSLVSSVLVSRGLSDPVKASAFLDCGIDDLHDPRLLPDFDKAVSAILHAKETGERIFVHGDYDVDGVTSAALFTRFLKKIGCDVVPHVPHRMKEGYGIHLDAVAKARESGAKLFLTCDCGISAHEQVDAAREAGMVVVVTDHHEVGETVPSAVAVVDPHRADSKYPWPALSGVGVVFKLCAGITEELGHPVGGFYRAYLDLAVLGTVADVMPLLGENRVITKFGLPQLSATKKPGLKALLNVSKLSGKRLTARHIGFQLGPRINAVGRIDDAGIALDLLMTEDDDRAREIAQVLDSTNEQRRAHQTQMFEEAVALVESTRANEHFVIVVAQDGWHPGLIGIVAGKLVERYNRPTFVIAIDDTAAKGSARSIIGFHLAKALDECRELLTSGGGHELAAGFSLEAGNVDEFADTLRKYAATVLTPQDLVPRFHLDAIVGGLEADRSALEQLQRLEPFGQANPEPLFGTHEAKVISHSPTSNPEHARLRIAAKDGAEHDAMVFGIAQGLEQYGPDTPLDLAFTMEESHWNGQARFRWIVRDYKPSVV